MVRCSGEINDVGQPLIHRHIERTIKLETRVGEFEVVRGLTRFQRLMIGGTMVRHTYIPIPVHILSGEELEPIERIEASERAPAESSDDRFAGDRRGSKGMVEVSWLA